jgi:LPS sulfotransferase NodH
MVAIGCTLRSGSNLLGEILRANGFGEPKEWFQDGTGIANRGGSSSELRVLALQLRDFEASHRGGWLGVKFSWPQFLRLGTVGRNVPEAAPLLACLPDARWILLRRRDIARQAVSLYAAQTTGAWMGETSADYDLLARDFDAMHERFAALAAESFAWDEHFRTHPTPVAVIDYEDMVKWHHDAWRALFLKLDPAFDRDDLDLSELAVPPRIDHRLDAVKDWFHGELVSGQRPRSTMAMLEEIGAMVERIAPATATSVIDRFLSDRFSIPDGFALRKFDLRRDVTLAGEAAILEQGHFLDRVAIRLGAGATSRFTSAGRRLMLQFHAHAWSGIAELRVGETVERIDLFSNRADTRHVIRELPPCFDGDIVVSSATEKNILSDGWEVWLQRVVVLA